MTTATRTIPTAEKTVVTTIPKATDVAAVPPKSTGIVRYSITEADVAAIEAKRGLKVLDITDRKQLKAVEELHREAKKGRTTVDRERTEANKSLRKQIEDEIEWNNNAAAALQSRLNPIEEEAKAEIERVEAALEAERVAAKNAMLNDRKAALSAAVGEFTDMLLPYPDDYIANAPESAFKPLLESLPVQVAVRKAAAEQARVAKEAADKAAAEQAAQLERDRIARERQQAVDDSKRAEDAKALADGLADLARQRAEMAADLEKKQKAIDDQQKQIEETRRALAPPEPFAMTDDDAAYITRIDADDARKADEIATLSEAAGIPRDTFRRAPEPPATATEVAMKPDILKLAEWVNLIESAASEAIPDVSGAVMDLRGEMTRDLSCCIDAMRGRLT